MHRDVDLAAQQRVAQRADEDAGAAGLLERGAGGLGAVALGGHLDQLGLAAEPVADQRGDELGLGGGEQRGAGADPDRGAGHDSPSGRVTASTASGSSANSSASAAA